MKDESVKDESVKDFPEFILASRSPQRCALLRQAGYRFRVIAPPLPEPQSVPPATTPAQVAQALAYFKARAVQRDNPDWFVLGADTVVACGDHVFGKAADEQEARRMLATLSRNRHAVITGLAVLPPAPALGATGGARERFLASETTHVTMRPLSEADIDRYLAGGQWRDKAGAYAIQASADAFVDRLEGSVSNVVGLPMELLERLFAQVLRCLPTRA